MTFDFDNPLPLAVFAAESQGRLRYRSPLVMYTNAFEERPRTVWMSPQVEAVTGYGVDEWVGKGRFLESLVHPDDRESVDEEARASRRELRPFSLDYRLRSRDGRDVWIHDESVPVLDRNGDPEFIQGYFLDITERKRLEEELQRARKTEALGRMAAAVAHDFNNVLTVVAGSAAAAEQTIEEGHPARRLLAEIGHAVDCAVRLTRQLLAFARRQELDPRIVDLAELVRSAEPMLAQLAGDGVRLELAVLPDVWVSADVAQLEQVLLNLVSNARAAMPDGGRIRVAVAAEQGEALLAVSDEGIGMDEETLARAFDPFFTTRKREGGTGLGLATVDGIVRQSGGAVEVTTAPGKGTTVRIRLPLADVG